MNAFLLPVVNYLRDEDASDTVLCGAWRTRYPADVAAATAAAGPLIAALDAVTSKQTSPGQGKPEKISGNRPKTAPARLLLGY